MIKKILLSLLLIIVIFFTFIFSKFEIDKSKVYTVANFEISEDVKNADLSLGKRIYEVRAGCIDCHGENLAGKMVMENGAMGSIYGANITPYALKNWSDKEIAVAIRYGVHKTGKALQFMPSFDYQGYSKDDIAAVIKYIRSVPEVNQDSHKNSFGPVAKILSGLGKMPVMFSAKTLDSNIGFTSKPKEEVSIEFGKYLANACVGCHGREFTGGPIPGGDPSWPHAANIRLGKNVSWTKDSFKTMIKTGESPITKSKLRPPMPVWLLSKMDDLEIDSLWMYLSSLK